MAENYASSVWAGAALGPRACRAATPLPNAGQWYVEITPKCDPNTADGSPLGNSSDCCREGVVCFSLRKRRRVAPRPQSSSAPPTFPPFSPFLSVPRIWPCIPCLSRLHCLSHASSLSPYLCPPAPHSFPSASPFCLLTLSLRR